MFEVPLVEKYRPTSIDEYLFQDEDVEKTVREWVNNGNLPTASLFVGGPGCGKSSLSSVLINEMDIDPMDVLRINGSINNGIGYVREVLDPWLQRASFSKFKVVQFEEMDILSFSAQKAILQIIEDNYQHVRWIGTANYTHRLDPAIHSRFQVLNMSPINYDGIMGIVADIIDDEGIDIGEDIDDIMSHIDAYAPDIRKILNSIQQHSSGGVLRALSSTASTAQGIEEWEALWQSDGELDLERALELSKFIDGNNFESYYEVMYTNHHKLPNIAQGIVLISQYLDRASRCANQSLHLDACLYHIFMEEE